MAHQGIQPRQGMSACRHGGPHGCGDPGCIFCPTPPLFSFMRPPKSDVQHSGVVGASTQVGASKNRPPSASTSSSAQSMDIEEDSRSRASAELTGKKKQLRGAAAATTQKYKMPLPVDAPLSNGQGMSAPGRFCMKQLKFNDKEWHEAGRLSEQMGRIWGVEMPPEFAACSKHKSQISTRIKRDLRGWRGSPQPSEGLKTLCMQLQRSHDALRPPSVDSNAGSVISKRSKMAKSLSHSEIIDSERTVETCRADSGSGANKPKWILPRSLSSNLIAYIDDIQASVSEFERTRAIDKLKYGSAR